MHVHYYRVRNCLKSTFLLISNIVSFFLSLLKTLDINSADDEKYPEYEYPEYPEYGTCTTIRGPRPNKPCVFPFTFNGERKSTCIKGRRRPEPWCSTKVDNGNNYIRGEWGYCGDCLDLGMKIIFDYVLIKVVI